MKKYSLHALWFTSVVLMLVLARLWIDSSGQLRSIRWESPGPQVVDYGSMVPSLPRVAPVDTSQFIGMLDRPVFSPTRRPPPPPPPPEEKAPIDNLSTARLSGLFMGDSGGGVIIQIAGKHKRVKLQDVVEGWTLTAIQDRSVTFIRGGQSRVLQLPRAALTTYAGLPPSAGATAPSAALSLPQPVSNSAPVQQPSARPVERALVPTFGGGAP